LRGVKIGLPGLYGASYIGLIAMLEAGGMTEDDVNLISIGFNQVEAIVSGQVESAVIYLANEPVVLRSQGYAVDVVRVADYMQLVSNGLVTNEATIKKNPEMVKAFIGAMLQGIADTVENPIAAFEISKKYVENLADADTDLQRQILGESIVLWQTERLGYTDPVGWINMQTVLLKMGLLTETQDLEKAFTNEFLP
jgi:NitT/TauT family transport system substrate-binding protein